MTSPQRMHTPPFPSQPQPTARHCRENKENVRRDLIAEEAAKCQRCSLYQHATQVVFGEGSIPALLMMVGEQPGDQEDREGRPFVGPAGRMLDAGLGELKLDRRLIYVTNAVKHFKHEQQGKRRNPQAPESFRTGTMPLVAKSRILAGETEAGDCSWCGCGGSAHGSPCRLGARARPPFTMGGRTPGPCDDPPLCHFARTGRDFKARCLFQFHRRVAAGCRFGWRAN